MQKIHHNRRGYPGHGQHFVGSGEVKRKLKEAKLKLNTT
jgi:hypothetical protein